jgi:hypothetical protein
LISGAFAEWLFPAAASACPVCYGASDPRTLTAFYVSTVALVLLPLLLVGGFVFWISRAGRRAASRHASVAADAAAEG